MSLWQKRCRCALSISVRPQRRLERVTHRERSVTALWQSIAVGRGLPCARRGRDGDSGEGKFVAQGLADRALDSAIDFVRFAKPHLHLGRVYVDVHGIRRDADVQDKHWKSPN